MVDFNNTSEAQGPGSFNDFIEGNPDLNRAEQLAAYSAELQVNKKRLMKSYGEVALNGSPLIESLGRND
jgi:hypothetical protein